ncbi:four helix bundle protein [Myroides sp. 1354]|uniref:four helix bundle protein n=1 Tax=unclassified Myroides TaxID=2642485 RepID=UPI002577EB42|nr:MULTISPECIES: four helix bundle protein [unclassified Myroides]MDM1045406.1 four helix bundle protein [Myroides sp. R163-1]MDM1056357.1 four helix bundle protein [Myroides sp. 1354]MDM1069537.1 four helix bundle protein [Myroides sp. 1372]
MHVFYFEKLLVWQNARNVTKDIYLVTRKFSVDEKFGLVSQLRRAIASVASNVAEGMSRSTNKDRLRMINISYSSAIEVINFLILSLDLGFITEEEYRELRQKIELITNQLQSLGKKLKE